MNRFFMPVSIGQFHIIRNGVCKPLALFRIFFFQRFVDHQFGIGNSHARGACVKSIRDRISGDSDRGIYRIAIDLALFHSDPGTLVRAGITDDVAGERGEARSPISLCECDHPSMSA